MYFLIREATQTNKQTNKHTTYHRNIKQIKMFEKKKLDANHRKLYFNRSCISISINWVSICLHYVKKKGQPKKFSY